jgi:hypothetical protein
MTVPMMQRMEGPVVRTPLPSCRRAPPHAADIVDVDVLACRDGFRGFSDDCTVFVDVLTLGDISYCYLVEEADVLSRNQLPALAIYLHRNALSAPDISCRGGDVVSGPYYYDCCLLRHAASPSSRNHSVSVVLHIWH